MDAKDGVNKFNTIKLHWTDHPDRDQNWRDEQDKNLGPSKAAQECGIRLQTLQDRAKGKTSLDTVSPGKQPLLSWQDEDRLAKHLSKMATWGYGYTIAEVLEIATDYAKTLKKITGPRKLGRNWYSRFMSRNKNSLKVV